MARGHGGRAHGRGRGRGAVQGAQKTAQQSVGKQGYHGAEALDPVLPLIFRNLDERSLARAGQVSKAWQMASHDSRSYSTHLHFPTDLFREHAYGSSARLLAQPLLLVEFARQRSSTLTELTLDSVAGVYHFAMLQFISLPSLRRLFIKANIEARVVIKSLAEPAFLPHLAFLAFEQQQQAGPLTVHRSPASINASSLKEIHNIRPSLVMNCRECPRENCSTISTALSNENQKWPKCDECGDEFCTGQMTCLRGRPGEYSHLWQCFHCKKIAHEACRPMSGCLSHAHRAALDQPLLVDMDGIPTPLPVTRKSAGVHCGCMPEVKNFPCPSCTLKQLVYLVFCLSSSVEWLISPISRCEQCWKSVRSKKCSFCQRKECASCFVETLHYGASRSKPGCARCHRYACRDCRKLDPGRGLVACEKPEHGRTCLNCLRKAMPAEAHLKCEISSCHAGVCPVKSHPSELVVYKGKAMCMDHFRDVHMPHTYECSNCGELHGDFDSEEDYLYGDDDDDDDEDDYGM